MMFDVDNMKKTIFFLMLAACTIGCKAGHEQTTAVASQQDDVQVEAPNFTLEDLDGNRLSLTSLRGKYVVVDFWGSWCPWCIKGFPKMKEYYQKYKDKLEIVGVDCGDTKAKWKAAVAEYELPWKHVYCPKNSKVIEDYGVQGFPSKVIIDPKGNVVEGIEGEDPRFYTLLDQLLK